MAVPLLEAVTVVRVSGSGEDSYVLGAVRTDGALLCARLQVDPDAPPTPPARLRRLPDADGVPVFGVAE